MLWWHRAYTTHAYYAIFENFIRHQTLANSRNTVFVIGGVHWLATFHLKSLKQLLRRTGLEQSHVIVKTLGAGFHQQVDGLHRLTLVSSEGSQWWWNRSLLVTCLKHHDKYVIRLMTTDDDVDVISIWALTWRVSLFITLKTKACSCFRPNSGNWYFTTEASSA